MRAFIALLMATLSFANPVLAGKRLKVLFIGNSYTHFNSMPQIVADMATATGDTLDFDMYAPGGYTFDNHDNDMVTFAKISQGGWDFMVLQEQSQLPAVIGFSTGIAPLISSFRQYNPCGRVMLFMTWGRKNGDAFNCVNYPHVCTYLGMDSALRETYIKGAKDYKCELSPVGAAWRNVRTNNPAINLYEPDNSHPTANGSYLAASCFYAALFKKDPVAVNFNFSLSALTAGMLKQAAKTVVFDSLSHWSHSMTLPVAEFSYYIGAGINQVQFINKSKHADSYLWDFGDGNTSAAQHPAHSYAANGTYTIKLTALNCDIDTTYQTIHQTTLSFCVHTPVVTPQSVTLCPGATDTLWTQQYDAYQWYDENMVPVPGANAQSFEVSTYNMYSVAAKLNGCTEFSAPATVNTASGVSPWFLLPSGGDLVGADTACYGDTITLEVKFNKPPVAGDSLIDWSFNGQPVTGYHNDTLLVTQSGIYEATVRHALCTGLYKANQVQLTFIDCTNNVSEMTAPSFTLAPNPVSQLLNISSKAFASNVYTLRITNSLGQLLYNKQSSYGIQPVLDMSVYPGGVYFINIASEGKTVFRAKVLKQ